MLTFSQIFKEYQLGQQKVTALKGVDGEIAQGEMVLRFMSGDEDSIYATLLDKGMIFINFKGRF